MALGFASLGLVRTIDIALTHTVAGITNRANIISRNFAAPLIGATASTQIGLRNRNSQTNVECNGVQTHVEHIDPEIQLIQISCHMHMECMNIYRYVSRTFIPNLVHARTLLNLPNRLACVCSCYDCDVGLKTIYTSRNMLFALTREARLELVSKHQKRMHFQKVIQSSCQSCAGGGRRLSFLACNFLSLKLQIELAELTDREFSCYLRGCGSLHYSGPQGQYKSIYTKISILVQNYLFLYNNLFSGRKIFIAVH